MSHTEMQAKLIVRHEVWKEKVILSYGVHEPL